MRLTLLVALAAAAVTSGVALAVDRFQWEVELSQWLQSFSLGPFDFLRGLLFWMGVRGVAGATMLAVCAALWLRRWRLESAFVAMTLGPDLLNLVLKELIGRPRPTDDLVDVTVGWGGIQGSGFPSGHAVHAVVFYGLLLYLAWRYVPSRPLVRAIAVAVVGYVLATGPWLLYDGRHWLLDVLGGYAYGSVYLLSIMWAYERALARLRAGEGGRLARLLVRGPDKATPA
ncbi:MAG: phosphatase PAP2 family protein [Chloroflexota bacterium]|nr:phosphatase PAP2 family protein [Chloroflexota bacterium]MDE2941388.1 phosphatase PAP2 family protein [Chloroflexota bacterium]MDE3267487.1 phosphatase PAP2 family protein [Chloroflexota bacterium]